MKFSIAFIVVLTLWAALVIQVFKGNYEHRSQQIEIATERARADEMAAEVRLLKRQGLEVRKTLDRKKLAGIESFQVKLEESFEVAAAKLAVIEPVDGCVVIRSVPTLDQPDGMRQLRRISVPESRRIAVRVAFFLRPQTGASYSSSSLEEVEVSLDFDGDQPVEFPLDTGIHEIGIDYDYGSQHKKPVIRLTIDGEEKGRWTSYSEGGNGYGASSTSWHVQEVYKLGRTLPLLLKLNPGDTQTEVRFSIVERQGQNEDV